MKVHKAFYLQNFDKHCLRNEVRWYKTFYTFKSKVAASCAPGHMKGAN